MTEKRFLLKYSEYETLNGETIESEPYFVDINEEYVDEEYYFTIDGYPTMSDNQVVDLLNKLSEENNELKQTIKTIKEICNQHKIPNLLTTYIPVNCEKRKGCLDNHMANANNMGKSNLAKEILELI